MKSDKKIIILFIFSISGLLFSGYMSGVKLITDTCVFNEPCPIFLGLPACYFGFGMFLALFILSSGILTKNIRFNGLKAVIVISIAGMFFSGYFTLRELPLLLSSGFTGYMLGLPTCALGLIFYILIFITGLFIFKDKRIKLNK